jgi:hypothetical protein
MSSDDVNFQEAPLNTHQFELILKDDFEALHFVDRVSRIYESYYNEESDIKSKLLSALSSPERIVEEEEENDEDGMKEGHMTTLGLADRISNPFKPRVNRYAVDRTMLSRESSARSSSPEDKWNMSNLLSPQDRFMAYRYNTPQKRHHSSPIRRTIRSSNKVTRIVEGHLMPIRDTSGSKPRNSFLNDESKLYLILQESSKKKLEKT